jgi:hypothetical protein
MNRFEIRINAAGTFRWVHDNRNNCRIEMEKVCDYLNKQEEKNKRGIKI